MQESSWLADSLKRPKNSTVVVDAFVIIIYGVGTLPPVPEVAAPPLPPDPDAPITNPKLYQPPLLFVSYIPTSGLNKLTINVMGMIIPCHRPIQNPAGSIPGC